MCTISKRLFKCILQIPTLNIHRMRIYLFEFLTIPQIVVYPFGAVVSA